MAESETAMAAYPTFGGQPGVPAAFPSTQRVIFATEFRRRLRDKSLRSMLTSSNWKGKFKGAGSEITIPVPPLVKTRKRRPGDEVKYQELKGAEETFTINREREAAFHNEIEDNLFSPLDIDAKCNEEMVAQIAEDIDYEFFADIPGKCHKANRGNEAGIRSGSYELGTALNPVYLFKTDTDASAKKATLGHTASATQYISSASSMSKEWPGASQLGKWHAIVPTVIQDRLINSELKFANEMGDQVSVLRKGVDYIGEINGMNIIGCNQLPIWNETTDKSLPKRFGVLFINAEAIESVEEFRFDEKLQKTEAWGWFYRSMVIYDWFIRYPELFGFGVVALG